MGCCNITIDTLWLCYCELGRPEWYYSYHIGDKINTRVLSFKQILLIDNNNNNIQYLYSALSLKQLKALIA